MDRIKTMETPRMDREDMSKMDKVYNWADRNIWRVGYIAGVVNGEVLLTAITNPEGIQWFSIITGTIGIAMGYLLISIKVHHPERTEI